MKLFTDLLNSNFIGQCYTLHILEKNPYDSRVKVISRIFFWLKELKSQMSRDLIAYCDSNEEKMRWANYKNYRHQKLWTISLELKNETIFNSTHPKKESSIRTIIDTGNVFKSKFGIRNEEKRMTKKNSSPLHTNSRKYLWNESSNFLWPYTDK